MTFTQQARVAVLTLMAAMALVDPAAAAWPRSANANLAIASAVSGSDLRPAMAPDGTGGMIITWFDTRSFNQDIYAQRVSNKGVPLWAPGGVVVCSNPSDQSYPTIVPDGAGGALITWHDLRSGTFDLYAQRINSAGVPQWATDGVPVCTAVTGQYHLDSVSDGQGGVISTWLDERGGDGGDIYAQRLNGSGVPQWAGNGVAVCTAVNMQQIPIPVSDGAGGAIIAWTDARLPGVAVYAQRIVAAGTALWAANGVQVVYGGFDTTVAADGAGGAIIAWADARSGGANYNIYAQRLNSAGSALWIANSVPVCTQFSNQAKPKVVADGSGGGIVSWTDWRASLIENLLDVYAQRVSAAGVPQWTNDGVGLSTGLGAQEVAEIASDGAGGAIVVWQDARSGAGSRDVYARRVSAAGVPQGLADGAAVSNAANNQTLPGIIADGRRGAIVAWYDARTGAGPGLYAQRLDSDGFLGNPEPEIVSVKDLPNDQGGHLRLKWNACYRDTFPTLEVGAYGVWRQVTAAVAASNRARSAIRMESNGTQVTYWEGVGTVLARGEPWYTFVVDTFQDSTGAANPNTVYMVDAHDGYQPRIWTSVPDSGYSVDNLPPAAPAPFTGVYVAGISHLDWGQNLENDLAGYRLHRGATYGFVPGPGNQVASLTGTHFDDPAPAGSFYKLAAVDVHGNPSSFTPLAFGTTDAPGGAAPRELNLAAPMPNPARTGTTLRFGLPRPAPVSLAVYDASGRTIRTLTSGPHAAGEYSLHWDLDDEQGRVVANGLYWIRLIAEGRELTRRIVCTR